MHSNGSTYWKIYRALKRWAGIKSHYELENPDVELSILRGKKVDYIVLVNHSLKVEEGKVNLQHMVSQVQMIEPEAKTKIAQNSHQFPFKLEGFSGLVFEVEK